MILDGKLVYLEKDIKTKEELFEFVYTELYSHGYVHENWLEGISERENTFPTGLPLADFGVAIPHTDAERVIKDQIIIVSLKNPVIFRSMDGSGDVKVEMIISLALSSAHGQLEMLQKLMGIFGDDEYIKAIRNAKDVNKVIELMNHKDIY